jgi:AraC family transcriptional regulator
MPPRRALLQLLREMRGRLDDNLSLEELAGRSGWSRFHFHRAFRRLVGETPKQYMLRLRLERAAARLAASSDRVLAVAVATGFTSHEVFTRAFHRRFGRTPTNYRAAALADVPAVRARHRDVVDAAGPCIGLFHLPIHDASRRSSMPTLSIARDEIAAQPTLFVRLRPARHELAAAIAGGVGKTYAHSQKAGLAFAGQPFTRYLSTGPGVLSIEVGLPLAAAGRGDGDVEAGELPGGPVAVGIHAGPYDQLTETYAALERWIEANGFHTAGPPWESYTTDPADYPDPADWRTVVYWPISR